MPISINRVITHGGSMRIMRALKYLLGITMLVFIFHNAIAAPPERGGNSGTPTQNWDKNLSNASRFTVLTEFGGAAVRDNNTGVVWEQEPDPTNRIWSDATLYCASKIIGSTAGWRLPSVVELK